LKFTCQNRAHQAAGKLQKHSNHLKRWACVTGECIINIGVFIEIKLNAREKTLLVGEKYEDFETHFRIKWTILCENQFQNPHQRSTLAQRNLYNFRTHENKWQNTFLDTTRLKYVYLVLTRAASNLTVSSGATQDYMSEFQARPHDCICSLLLKTATVKAYKSALSLQDSFPQARRCLCKTDALNSKCKILLRIRQPKSEA
jgi:hypothetical protein